ncbi:hypothetical protein B2J93_2467 [Marssonina coronariae]|uniref:Nuclear GTPase SLIP-GC n=1 Tax=Diplocarpon coronariae TaxID=2795749 RepID=A0A218YRZ5_9HELO|nr:hypothetical protein B2J93_2467 [Marssonina coronariae]
MDITGAAKKVKPKAPAKPKTPKTPKIPMMKRDRPIKFQKKGRKTKAGIEGLEVTAVAEQKGGKIGDEIRITRKEELSVLGKATLVQLRELMERDGGTHPECRSWVTQASNIIEMGQLPRIPIGLLGYTGSGKSSLINALVDEEILLPTNGMRASTSVVVELSYNQSQNPAEKYTAVVDFCSPAEWTAEFELLRSDIEGRPENEKLSSSSTSDAGVAFAKLKAVYPGKDISDFLDMTQKDIVEDPNLFKILGHSRRIYSESARNFGKQINQYIDSANQLSKNTSLELWPLVRLVKVLIKADILRQGLVLVDLPGLGDSNAGRAQVAEQYMKHLEHMWIVADINRAVDDKVAQELLGTSFQRQLLLNGNYHDRFVTFVMTRIDNVNTDEVIGNLELADGVLSAALKEETQLRETLEEAQEELDSLDDAEGVQSSSSVGQKRKRPKMDKSILKGKECLNLPETMTDTRIVERRNLLRKISHLRRLVAASEVSMRVQCIKQRSKYTQCRLREDFEYGIASLVQELVDSAVKTENELFTDPESIKLSANGLKSFCVSSKAYQKSQGRFKREDEIRGFSTSEDTGIPTLQAFARKCTLKSREVAVDRFDTELTLWKMSVKSWAEENRQAPVLSVQQSAKLLSELEYFRESLKLEEKRATKNMRQNMAVCITNHLTSHLEKAVTAGEVKVRILAKDKTTADIAAATWKALMRRYGEPYTTVKKDKSHHWNEDMVAPFMDPLILHWRDLFNKKLPCIHQRYYCRITEALKRFSERYSGFVFDVCGGYPPVQRLLDQIPLVEHRVGLEIGDALKARQQQASDAHKTLKNTIRKHMTQFYKNATHEHGNGMLNRLKVQFLKYIERHSNAMYFATSLTIIDELKKMHRIQLRETSLKVQKIMGEVTKDIFHTLKGADVGDEEYLQDSGDAKILLRRRVAHYLAELERKCSVISGSKDESRTGNQFILTDFEDSGIEFSENDEDDGGDTFLDALTEQFEARGCGDAEMGRGE